VRPEQCRPKHPGATALVHKLVCILCHLLKYQEAYDPKASAAAEKKLWAKKLKQLRQTAIGLGCKFVTATSLIRLVSYGGVIVGPDVADGLDSSESKPASLLSPKTNCSAVKPT